MFGKFDVTNHIDRILILSSSLLPLLEKVSFNPGFPRSRPDAPEQALQISTYLWLLKRTKWLNEWLFFWEVSLQNSELNIQYIFVMVYVKWTLLRRGGVDSSSPVVNKFVKDQSPGFPEFRLILLSWRKYVSNDTNLILVTFTTTCSSLIFKIKLKNSYWC